MSLKWENIFNTGHKDWFAWSSDCKVYQFGDAKKAAQTGGYNLFTWDDKIFDISKNQFIQGKTVLDIK